VTVIIFVFVFTIHSIACTPVTHVVQSARNELRHVDVRVEVSLAHQAGQTVAPAFTKAANNKDFILVPSLPFDLLQYVSSSRLETRHFAVESCLVELLVQLTAQLSVGNFTSAMSEMCVMS
jgi:hypothetical protein